MKFQVTWTEMVEFSAEIEADSETEAREKFRDGQHTPAEQEDSRNVEDSEVFEDNVVNRKTWGHIP